MPTTMVGQYVKPRDWNALISDPNTVSGLRLQFYYLFYCSCSIQFVFPWDVVGCFVYYSHFSNLVGYVFSS